MVVEEFRAVQSYFRRVDALSRRDSLPVSLRSSAARLCAAYRDLVEESAAFLCAPCPISSSSSSSSSGSSSSSAAASSSSSLSLVAPVLAACPEALGVRRDGRLPVHHAADGRGGNALVAAYASVAREHDVVSDGRGGLLTTDPRLRPPRNPLQRLGSDDGAGPDALSDLHRRGLLRPEDVKRFALLHVAACGNDVDKARFLLGLDPSSLAKRKTVMPVAISAYDGNARMFAFLLDAGLRTGVPHGGLFETNKDLGTTFEVAADSMGTEKTLDVVRDAVHKSGQRTPLLHGALRCMGTGERLQTFLRTFPDHLYVRDETGRLPIHAALETGMDWSVDLLLVASANADSLRDEVDPVTGLHPFALAAAGGCGADTIYWLLRKHPHHLQAALFQGSYERHDNRQ